MPLFRAGSGNCGRSANGLGDVHAWLYGPCERFAAAVATAAGATSAVYQRMAWAGPVGTYTWSLQQYMYGRYHICPKRT